MRLLRNFSYDSSALEKYTTVQFSGVDRLPKNTVITRHTALFRHK